MTTQNEAAERLRIHLSNLTTERVYSVAWLDALDEALAAERRATVGRIREAFTEFWSDEAVKQDYAFHPSLLFRILDEEAAR